MTAIERNPSNRAVKDIRFRNRMKMATNRSFGPTH